MPNIPVQPIPGFHFAVSFLGLSFAATVDTMFQEVSGLSAELATEELVQGGENDVVYKLPQRTKYSNLTLKRALTPAPSGLTQWAEEAIYDFVFKPCELVVTLLNEQHLPVMGWNFKDAYPVKLSVSDLNAMSNSLLIESIELAYSKSARISTSTLMPKLL